jgi:ribonuclease R
MRLETAVGRQIVVLVVDDEDGAPLGRAQVAGPPRGRLAAGGPRAAVVVALGRAAPSLVPGGAAAAGLDPAEAETTHTRRGGAAGRRRAGRRRRPRRRRRRPGRRPRADRAPRRGLPDRSTTRPPATSTTPSAPGGTGAGRRPGEVAVHIADVAASVGIDSPADRYARTVASSGYLAVGDNAPMLDPALSEDACSLLPGGDRRVISVRFTVAPTATIGDVDGRDRRGRLLGAGVLRLPRGLARRTSRPRTCARSWAARTSSSGCCAPRWRPPAGSVSTATPGPPSRSCSTTPWSPRHRRRQAHGRGGRAPRPGLPARRAAHGRRERDRRRLAGRARRPRAVPGPHGAGGGPLRPPGRGGRRLAGAEVPSLRSRPADAATRWRRAGGRRRRAGDLELLAEIDRLGDEERHADRDLLVAAATSSMARASYDPDPSHHRGSPPPPTPISPRRSAATRTSWCTARSGRRWPARRRR